MLLLSSWLDPDGSDSDQYVWDNFTIQSNQTITEIDWFGGYDPAKFGSGGPTLDFSVSIFPSIAAGTEPDVVNPPLVHYQTGGNAGETSIGVVGGNTMYAYAFSLPAPFIASAGVKYWVQIEAFQHGIPDWCIEAGTGGDRSHFRKIVSPGGDGLYQIAPHDAAFTLLGPVANTLTNTPALTATLTLTDTPTNTLTDTPTNTATSTPTNTPTDTPTFAPAFTPTDTPTDIPTITSTFTTDTPTNTLTNTPTFAPTPTPLSSNTPGKITGGGSIDPKKGGNKAMFGFTVTSAQGDLAPRGNLTYIDHETGMRLSDTTIDLLVIDGTHAWFTGTAIVNGTKVQFEVEIDALSKFGQSDTFYIYIPALNNYSAGGALTGGNVTIHK